MPHILSLAMTKVVRDPWPRNYQTLTNTPGGDKLLVFSNSCFFFSSKLFNHFIFIIILGTKIFHHVGHKNIPSIDHKNILHFSHKNISLFWSQKYFINLITKIFFHFGPKNISSFWSQKYFNILVTRIFQHSSHKNISTF